MSAMFRVISPPTVDFKPLPDRCRRCAVVGNSGKLRQSGNGKLIDSHNSIIRYVMSKSHILPFLSSSSSSYSYFSPTGWTRRWLKGLRKTSGIGRRITSCTQRARWTSNMESASSSCRSNWETWSGWPARCPPAQWKCTKHQANTERNTLSYDQLMKLFWDTLTETDWLQI